VGSSEELGTDRKLGVSIYRADVEAVYRYLRDHGEATGVQIAEACFPLTFGSLDPLYKRLFRKSMAKTLLSVGWLRGQKVAITCLSKPGFPSTFVLGRVAQGPEALSSIDARHKVAVTVTAEGDQVTDDGDPMGDLMGLWHAT
jgi:hypothetical protein